VLQQTWYTAPGRHLPTPNHLQRQFKLDGTNPFWFTDTTYVRSHTGSPYLAVLIDSRSPLRVGWSVGTESVRRTQTAWRLASWYGRRF
jgi:transposase InsO family protein